MAAEKNTKRYKSVPLSHMLKFSNVTASSPVQRLNKELLLMYNKIRLSDEEIDIRKKTFLRYKTLVEGAMDCTVEAFGSSKTLMMVHSSDIDITILVNTSSRRDTAEYDDDRQFSNTCLSRIEKIIEGARCAKGPLIHIKKARTPILKLTDRRHGCKIDISVNKMDGIQTAEYIIGQVEKRPYLRYFVVLLKYFLKRRNLSDTSFGGLCSYAQFLMILDFIQLHPLIQNGNIDIESNIGVLFLDFFQYFGIDFPFERSSICVQDGEYRPNREGNVCIEDPVVSGNNVAGGCTSIRLIKDIFHYSYKVMSAAVSSRVDPRKGVVELWLRLDPKEMKARELMVKSHK